MKTLTALCLLLALVGPASAQQPVPSKLRVLVKPAEPFAFEKNGELTGYSVEVFKRIAKDEGLDYEFKTVKTVPEVLEALQKGEADVGVGALSITEEREKVIDFSHPFFDESGLQILAHGRSEGSALAAFGTLLKSGGLKVAGILLLALFAVSNVLWLAERKKNAESFPDSYKHGVFEALWWSVSTIITGGCENIAPRAVLGRLVGVIWMLGGIALTSYITATLAAAMTVNTLTSDVRNLGDLQSQVIGTVTGSSGEVYLKELKFTTQGFENVESAIAALEKGDVKAVVYDSPILRYYLNTHPGSDLQLAGAIFEKQNYGFALPLGSPLRKQLNKALLKPDVQAFCDELDKKWFSSDKDH
jgi:ABC-type amino acid transport substrate-binding protein